MSFHHRRHVLRAGLLSLADLVIGGPLSRADAAETRRGIFDAHLHIPADNGEIFQWNRVTRNMADFVAYLDKCEVRRGVISSALSNIAKTPEEYRQGNREVAKYAEKYRGRFRPSCVVTPFRVDEALREIEECHTLGFRWLGEFCNYMTHYRYDSPEWAQIMALAAKLKMVIQIHTGPPDEMRALAEGFPANTIVFPHLGGSLAQIEARIAIVAAHPNCAIDISGSGIERVGILEKAVKEIGADRVLYGSDFTINEPSAVIARVRNAFLTAEDREKILYRNVERLFGGR